MSELSLTLALVLPLGLALIWFGRQAWQQRSKATRANARLIALVNHSNDLIMILDRTGRAHYISPSIERILGFKTDAAVGQHYHTMSHREDHPMLDATWNRLLANPGSTEHIRYRTAHATRKWVMVETSASAHLDTPGIEGVLLMIRDVSAQVKAEQQLLRNKETLNRAQEIAHIGSWSLDVATNELIWSDETYRIFGIPMGTPMTMERFVECIHPDDRDMALTEWNAALAGAPYDIGHRIVVDGEILWVQEKADLVFDEQGQLLSGTGTVQDVTAQHMAATQLAELLDFSEKIIANSPLGIAVYRTDGPCVMANEAMARAFHLPLEQVQQQNFRRLPAWRVLGLLDAAMEALQRPTLVRTLVKGLSDTGEELALDVEFATIMRHGQPHLMLQVKDVSEFQAIEQALKEAMRMTEEASRSKSEFLANMSHEIRTPMNAVLGLAQLALDEARDPTLTGHLKQMYASANMLLGIINDILDYSKIEAGRLNLESREFPPSDFSTTLLGMFRLPCEQKGIALKNMMGDDIPPRLIGDSLRITQILINLVGNAVKFTEAGEITLAVMRCDNDTTAPGHTRLRFSVCDSGVGMDASALSRLFQPFVQADGSITRRYGGTGLGLTISRRLVLLMGGDITVTSTPGTGSCFQFELDFAVPAITASPLKESPPDLENTSLGQMASTIAGAHVLLVEDDLVNQHVAARLLERAGLKISVANHGGEALEQLATTEFDAVLMDLQMPEVDGFEATRRIRAESRWATLPIIAFTAGAMVHDRGKCLAAGMSDFVVKPVQPQQLIAALLRHIAPRHAAEPHRAVPPAPTFALDIPKLVNSLHQLQQRIQENEFIASAELTELRALTEPLLETRGAIATRIEAAVSRYDYTTAKTLITGLLAALQVGDRSRSP